MDHRIFVSAAIFGTLCACAPARADRVASPGALIPTQTSPYKVELLSPSGVQLPTYQRGARHYVLGMTEGRYIIRVTNPTAARIEAVVSVDGLDVIDGLAANFRTKRGYVVPPYGEVRIEGFRTSASQVAAFRFSSVPRSYAGRKGVPRNIGVIGVAIFEEAARPVMIQPYRQAPPPPVADRYRAPVGKGAAPNASRPAPAMERGMAGADSGRAVRDEAARCCTEHYPNINRPGLGTEFGERRYSAVSWTRFVRRHPNRPDAIATLRYNDAAGLRALGIRVAPVPDSTETWTRETADPFPASPGYAEPPR